MDMRQRISFEHLLLIAEAVLEIPYRELERTVCIYRAEASLAAPFARVNGIFLHRDPVERAAVGAIRLTRSRPFPEGDNAEVAYICMREMLIRGHYRWTRPDQSGDPPKAFRQLEARKMSDLEFIAWVRDWAELDPGLEGAMA